VTKRVNRPGNAGPALGLVPILERLLEKICTAFLKQRIRVRLDGGFGNPRVLDSLDAAGVAYDRAHDYGSCGRADCLQLCGVVPQHLAGSLAR
jgi:hypothetical protein